MAKTTKSAQSTEAAPGEKPAAKKTADKKSTARKEATPAKKTTTVKKNTVKAAAEKKTAAVKNPAAKKTAAVKKPSAGTIVKKIPAKAAAEKKIAADKKPAAKKTAAVKEPSAGITIKKIAAKTTVEKKTASVKKPAAKKEPPVKEAVPVKKTAVVKEPSAGAAVKKTVAPRPPAAPKQAAPILKIENLFEAYAQDPVKMSKERGYIVSASFSANPAYAVYEIWSFFDAEKMYSTSVGLTFVCKGKKLYILVEPASYTDKQTEPADRKEGEKIEKHFSDLEIISAGEQGKIMIAKEPSETFGTFTVTKPSGRNFVLVLRKLPDVYASLEGLLEKSFAEGVPQPDSKTAAALTIKTVQKAMPV